MRDHNRRDAHEGSVTGGSRRRLPPWSARLHTVEKLLYRATDAEDSPRSERLRQLVGHEPAVLDEVFQRPERKLAVAAAGERVLTRHHLVQHHAQRPDVVGFLGREAREHLRRQIAQRAALRVGVVRLASQTEVQQLRRPVRGEPDVARLDVPVQIPGLMQRRQRVGQQGGHRKRPRGRKRPAAKLVGQRTAGQELDDEDRAAPPRLDAVDLGHRRMGHRGHGPRLGLQRHQPRDRHARQRLDRDVALEPEVAGQPGLITAPGRFGRSSPPPPWTFARRFGTVHWEGRCRCDGRSSDDEVLGTYLLGRVGCHQRSRSHGPTLPPCR